MVFLVYTSFFFSLDVLKRFPLPIRNARSIRLYQVPVILHYISNRLFKVLSSIAFFSAQYHRDLGGVEEYYRATLLEVSIASCMRCLHEEDFSGQKSQRVHKRAGWSRSSSKVAVTLEALEICSF